MVVRVGTILIVLLTVGLGTAQQTAAQGSSSKADRTREWAKRLIERYDKDGNKMLDKDERANLRGKPAGADLNGDDVITLNELVAHLSSDDSKPAPPPKPEPAKPEPTASDASASPADPVERPARRDRSRTAATVGPKQEPSPPAERRLTSTSERKSYRFKSATERLPGGLPSWFASRDANQDGQVAMSEYSHSWTDRTAEEFCRLDLNNDGFITANECQGNN